MAYRAFRDDDEQAAAEAERPELFSDGSAWSEIAAGAVANTGTRVFQPAEFAAVSGVEGRVIPEPITATGAWTLRPAYESERLKAQFVTLDGLARFNDERAALADALRRATNPDAVRGYRLALYVIEQAMNDPARRTPWSRLLRDNDLRQIGIYRAADEPKLPTLRERLHKLKPGTCLPVTAAELQEYNRSGIQGYYLNRYSYPPPGGWQLCVGKKPIVGFGTAW